MLQTDEPKANGPTDQQTNGPMDQQTNGPTDQQTNGPKDQRTNRPTQPVIEMRGHILRGHTVQKFQKLSSTSYIS